MIPVYNTLTVAVYGVPRTRGDDPDMRNTSVEEYECSPHTRG